VCIAFVSFDSPYGTFPPDVAPWDKPLEPAEWKSLFKQLDLIITGPSCTFLVWAPTFAHGVIMNAMREANLHDIGNYDWVKTNANQTGVMRYVTSQEYGVIGYKGLKALNFHKVDVHPDERRNRWMGGSVSQFFRYEGKVVNVAQKPVALSSSLFGRHCPPGSTVLVLGSGSGTDVIAALSEGMNVIAIEKDAYQFRASISRVRGWIQLQMKPKPAKKAAQTPSKGKGEKDEAEAKSAKDSEPSEQAPLVERCIVCAGPEEDGYKFSPCFGCQTKMHDIPECRVDCADCKQEEVGKPFCSVSCHREKFPKHTVAQMPPQESQVVYLCFSYVIRLVCYPLFAYLTRNIHVTFRSIDHRHVNE
jgi:DNA modification methylase